MRSIHFEQISEPENEKLRSQVTRLQECVCELLMKNEQLRQKLQESKGS